MKTILPFALAATLLVGCQGPKYTAFAPFDARLEPTLNGKSVYCVLLNRSEQAIHNYTFSAYVWSIPDATRQPRMVFRGFASGTEASPGSSIRFRPRGMGIEAPIIFPVSKLEVVGHCDEGDFRQAWVNTESGQLRPLTSNLR